MPTSCIDHLVITAPSLAVGSKMVQEALGVWPQAGGEHTRMSTHNALLRLGEKVYLEVIAINPAAPQPDRPRWFELDAGARDRLPQLVTWVARCDDLSAARALCGPSHGEIDAMSRGDLRWSITVPKDGSLPFNGVAPTLIQWHTPDHPAGRLADSGCELVELLGVHPEADGLGTWLEQIGFRGGFSIARGQQAQLIARIKTPSGMRELMGKLEISP
jgi:Glyoxalase-like domain